MAATWMIICREISTSSRCCGKRNFRMIQLFNKRGSREFKAARHNNPKPLVPIDTRGLKPTGRWEGDKWVNIPEMIPELVVPSLKDFHLKPYVSYRSQNIEKPEFTAKHLFYLTYAKKIRDDFKNSQLGPNGEPLNPSEIEKMTPEEARIRAEKTGTDIFQVDKL